MNTNFQGKRMQKEKASCKCLSIIILDFVVKAKKKHYPQTLEECKYKPKKMKMEKLINNDLEKSSSDKSDNEADNDFNDEMESDDDNDQSNE